MPSIVKCILLEFSRLSCSKLVKQSCSKAISVFSVSKFRKALLSKLSLKDKSLKETKESEQYAIESNAISSIKLK